MYILVFVLLLLDIVFSAVHSTINRFGDNYSWMTTESNCDNMIVWCYRFINLLFSDSKQF